MLNIPAALFTKYSLLLDEKSVPNSLHNNYKKRNQDGVKPYLLTKESIV